MRQIVLDTETTGLSPEQGHRIIEIAGVEMIDRMLTGNHYHVYINPERDIDEAAIKVHGITLESLHGKPIFSDIAQECFEFFDGAELIIHNAPFDIGFLDHEFKWLKKNYPPLSKVCKITDTLAMAKKRHVGQRNNLDALCKRYNINNTNRALHGALIDAELLAFVYLAMTGGQNSLFGSEETTQTHQAHEHNFERSAKAEALKVIAANSEENQRHHDYLEKLSTKEKACLWKALELEGPDEE